MNWYTDRAYKVDPNVYYTMIGYHRGNPSNEKSVWDTREVSIKEEYECFVKAYRNNWIYYKSNKKFLFGVKDNYGKIGTGKLPHRKNLHVAKFKCDTQNIQFHGYPVDHTRIHDKVPLDILRIWRSKDIITKIQMSRMSRCEE